MTAEQAHESPCDAEEQLLLEGFLKLDTPEGYRAEFIEGEVVVSPPPGGDHEDGFADLTFQIVKHSAVDMHVSGTKGLIMDSGGRCTKNLVIPDLVVAPRELRLFRGADQWMPVDGVTMVVEITSGKPDRDRVVKRHCYAKASIPLYLLVDRAKKTVTLFSDPDPGREDYVQDVRVPFAKTLELPEPFAFTLDTNFA